MKKVMLMLLVALAVPAFAADVAIDASGKITVTTVEGENLRGLAIVVTSENPITEVTGVGAEFNVFMDSAWDEVVNGDGEYAIGDGTPVANPAAKGPIALPATSISLCMGKVDMAEGQAAVTAGTVDVATVVTSGVVTVTLDTLRGGIVGDAVTPDPDGEILAGATIGPVGCVTCKGDQSGDSRVSLTDLGAIVSLIKDYAAEGYSVATPAGYECSDIDGDGTVSLTDLGLLVGYIKDFKVDGYDAPCNPAW